jgi:hypothetical protein
VQTVCDWAAHAGFAAVTLSTFRSPPLHCIVDHEQARGLDLAQRVVMRREVLADPT